jgi:hypothetical protein
MSAEEVKTANGNADAAKDVQDLLAELKEDADKKPETEAPAEEDEAAKEARIIAEATKLGKEQESKEERKPAERPRRNYRENIKSDLTAQEVTDNHDEIRKQVCTLKVRLGFGEYDSNSNRLNFISQTPTSPWTTSFSRRSAEVQITPLSFLSFTASSECAASSLSAPSSRL